MAGPTASVLLRRALDGPAIGDVFEELGRRASRRAGDDWLFGDRPFLVDVAEEYPGELSEIASGGLPDVLGWAPQGMLSFAAMSNETEDHRLLAELCVAFARRLDGIVDYGGSLLGDVCLSGARPRAPVRVDEPRGLPGVMWVTTYLIDEDRYGSSEYSDAVFLAAWLKEPAFRMVK